MNPVDALVEQAHAAAAVNFICVFVALLVGDRRAALVFLIFTAIALWFAAHAVMAK